MHSSEWRKTVSRDHMLCDSHPMTSWKGPSYGDSIRSVATRDWGREGWTSGAQRMFRAEKQLCVTLY